MDDKNISGNQNPNPNPNPNPVPPTSDDPVATTVVNDLANNVVLTQAPAVNDKGDLKSGDGVETDISEDTDILAKPTGLLPSSYDQAQTPSPQDVPPATPPPGYRPTGRNKEAVLGGETVASTTENLTTAEKIDQVAKEGDENYWENYAREIELEKKIMEMGGVEKVENGEVPISPEMAKEMGVKPVVTAQTPMKTVTEFKVSGVALADEKVTEGKTKPIHTSYRWLVEWFVYELLKAHFVMKIVNKAWHREKKETGKTEKDQI